MRSFGFAAFLLIILFGLNVYCYNYVKTSTEELSTSIDRLINLTDNKDYKNAAVNFNMLKRRTEDSKKIWFLIINHQEIDNVDVTLKQCEAQLKKEADKELTASLNSLKYYINNIYEREKVNITNIF